MMKITKAWGAPGTGKTTFLLARIKMLRDNGYEQADFVVCTFGRRMADELQKKLAWDTKREGGQINTIHGVCRRLSNINKVISEKQKAEFCEKLSLPFYLEKSDDEEIPVISNKSKLGNLFFDANSFLLQNMLGATEISKYNEYEKLNRMVPHPGEFLRNTAQKYKEWKQENNVYDFDDMLQTAYEKKLSPFARVVVVDEFQDLTPLQYAIFCIWEKDADEVLIAGDPRQTIYSYRGASARFFENHPGELIVLSTSYRLPAQVWDFSKKILQNARLTCPNIATTEKIGNIKKITETAYYGAIGAPEFREDTIHLVRINEMCLPIAYALAEAGIPYSGLAGWGKNQIDFFNALIKVRSGMAGNEVKFTKQELEELLDAYPEDDFSEKKKFLREKMKEMKYDPMFENIFSWAAKDIFGKRALWNRIASDSVLEGTLYAYREDSLRRKKILHALKNHGKLISAITVSVSTIHAAKGREARSVFLHDSITKKIAVKLYSDFSVNTTENEANVFYVGASRSMQNLFIVESSKEYHYALPGVGI